MLSIQRLVGSSRAVLSFECPSIRHIEVYGMVNGKQVFKGTSSAQARWVLTKPQTSSDAVSGTISSANNTANQRKIKQPQVPQDIGHGADGIYVNGNDDVVVYETNGLTVTSPLKRKSMAAFYKNANNIEEWCKRKIFNLQATYDVPHDKRDSLFLPHHIEFFSKKIYPRISKTCGLSTTKNNRKWRDTFLFYMQRKGEYSPWDSLTIIAEYIVNQGGTRDLQYIEKQSYARLEAKKRLSKKEHDALFAKMTRNRRVNEAKTTYYTDNLIEIHPPNYRDNTKIGDAYWCSKPKLNIVYKTSQEERDTLITKEYLAPIVYEILDKHCKIPDYLDLYFYPQDQDSYWDQVRYTFCKSNNPASLNCSAAYVKEKSRTAGALQIAVVNREYRKNPHKMWQCEKGVFCELPGGAYLNAIYNNDLQTVQKLDKRATKEMKSSARQFDTNTGLEMIGIRFADYIEDITVSTLVANLYTYQYQYNSRACLGSNAQSRTFSFTTPKYRYENLYGMDVGSVGGDTISATYVVNPEFVPLVNKLGSHFGSVMDGMSAKALKFRGINATLKGAKQLQKKYSCDSPEIKQFERNLIDISSKLIRNTL